MTPAAELPTPSAPPISTEPENVTGYKGKREIPQDAKPFDEHFRARRKDLIAKCKDAEERRTQTAVTMVKRYRGDSLGFFYRGRWESMPTQGLKKYNLFWPVVRSNNTNWISTEIQLEMKAARSDPETTAGAAVCQALYEHIAAKEWTESFEEEMSELAQLQFIYHIESYFSKNEGNGVIKVPVTGDATLALGGSEYTCASCGSTGPGEVLGQDSKCPECGNPVTASQPEPQEFKGQAPAGFEDMPEGNNVTKLRSMFEIRIDEVNAKGADPTGAYWLNHHYLCYRYELYQLMPWLKEMLKDKPSAGEWSESLRWKRTLEVSAATQMTQSGQSKDDQNTGKPDDLLEYCRWWFLPIAVEDYVCPKYYKHPSGKFDIYPGENVRDAFERRGEKKYAGLYLSFVAEQIAIISNEDKNVRWTAGGWGLDAAGYWTKGLEDLLDIQEVVNELLTLQVDHAMHNTLPHLILDRRMFSAQNFKNRAGAVSYTRAGFHRDRPIADYLHQLVPGGMDPAVPALMGQMLDAGQNIMGVQPATVGAPDPTDQTYQGQLLKRQASVGLMIPSQKMKKRAKSAWSRHQLIIVQKFWTNERIMRVMSTVTDHSWDEADVFAFKNMDLQNDLVITGVEGTDIPKTLSEREQKLIGLLGSGIINNPEVPRQLQAMMFQYAGIPYDAGNYDSQRRSAESRLREIRELCELVTVNGGAYIQDPQTGAMIVNAESAQMILLQPNVKILPRQDDHEVHIEFYNEHIIALAASPDVDEFEITVLMARVDEHIAQIALNMRDQAGIQAAAEQPMRDAEAAGQPDPAAGEQDKAAAQAEADDRKAGMQRESDQRKSDDQELQRQHDRVEAQKARTHEATQKDKDREAKAQEAKARAAAAKKAPAGKR